MWKRAAAASATALAVLAAMSVGTSEGMPAQVGNESTGAAAHVVQAQVERASFNVTPRAEEHWWGTTLKFNRESTEAIAGGLIGAGGVYTTVLGEGLVLVGLGVAAKMALDHGNCLQVVVTHAGTINPWRWHC